MAPEEIAWEMMKSRDFQNTKCEHGGPDDAPVFSVGVPRLDTAYTDSTVGIGYGEMSFKRFAAGGYEACGDGEKADHCVEKTCDRCLTNRFRSSSV